MNSLPVSTMDVNSINVAWCGTKRGWDSSHMFRLRSCFCRWKLDISRRICSSD